MKKSLLFLSLILLSTAASAETINFKDGHSVTGKIVQKDASQVKVDSNGITMTYYVDEIKDIDGKALEAPVAPAAVASPKLPDITATSLPIAANTQTAVDKKALILKFIDVFGTRSAMSRNFETILASLAQQKPEEAKKIRDNFKIDEVIDRLIPLYDKYFTAEDLQAYIDFYGSDKGKKLVSSIGSVLRDSVEVGTAYLKEKFPELNEEK